MEIRPSARKHGVEEADIQHALGERMRLVEYDYRGQDRLLVIGPDRHGRLLELVAVPVQTPHPHHPRRPATTEIPRLPEMR